MLTTFPATVIFSRNPFRGNVNIDRPTYSAHGSSPHYEVFVALFNAGHGGNPAKKSRLDQPRPA
jgi:hypothetical protein